MPTGYQEKERGNIFFALMKLVRYGQELQDFYLVCYQKDTIAYAKYCSICEVLLNINELYGSKHIANKVILGCINKNAVHYSKYFGNSKTSSSKKNSILSSLRKCFDTKRTGTPTFPSGKLSDYLKGITDMPEHAESIDNGYYHHSMSNYRKCVAPCNEICSNYSQDKEHIQTCMNKCKKPCKQFSMPKNISPQDLVDAGVAIGYAGEVVGNAIGDIATGMWEGCANNPLHCAMGLVPGGDMAMIAYQCMSGTCDAADIGMTLALNVTLGGGFAGKFAKVAVKKLARRLAGQVIRKPLGTIMRKSMLNSLKSKIGKKAMSFGIYNLRSITLDVPKSLAKKGARNQLRDKTTTILVNRLMGSSSNAETVTSKNFMDSLNSVSDD